MRFVAVGADVGERAHEFDLRVEIPLQRAAVGMQRHLQDAAAPLHFDEAVAAAVVVELRHSYISCLLEVLVNRRARRNP